ncbi:MAG: cation-translocating P-type ATPase [Lachnospiraceae bacterium]|nr:cation-translocating P-type ATPase [Lachnospiraceae bacterium]
MSFNIRKKKHIHEAPFKTEVEIVSADCEIGLTSAQVEERQACGWINTAVDDSQETTGTIIRKNLCTYFNFIFLFLAILLIMVGSFRNLSFMVVVVINTLIGIIQELRAKKVLDELNIVAAPKTEAVREGEHVTVPSDQLVRDDIVVFHAGNQIPADGIVVSGEVLVNEALLTGESKSVMKKTGDSLISGSFIVSGECFARLTAVGEDSYISQLTLEAKAMKKGEQSQMMRSLNHLLWIVGVALIPIGIALFVQSYTVTGETFAKSITSTVAALVGMIPEGLYLLASIALAVSSMNLARKRVLLHDMKSIETLARVDVLCVDKTGTITENSMEVKQLIPTRFYDSDAMPPLSSLVGDFTCAMKNDNQTMAAMKDYFQENTGQTPVKVTPFSSEVKYSAVTFESAAYVLGAPELLLGEDYADYEKEIDGYSARGYRVLVFGSYDGEITGQPLARPVTPLGFVLLSNPIRKAAPDTFSYFAEQGVEIKVISGDNPLTVSEAAKEAKIIGADKYVDASTLETQEDIDYAIKKYTVFGRVTPEQKRQFVQALKRQGRTVAMTGDGVNDVLALKDADCSVAMASGSDAAAQASQVVLLDSDFSCMPAVVLEGRRVVNNIQRSAVLFLVKNIFSFLLSLFSLASAITYPLEASQISLIGMWTIGIPGFFLALRSDHSRIQGHFLSNVMLQALPGGVTDMLAVSFLTVFGLVFGLDSASVSTAAMYLVAIVGFMILYQVTDPHKFSDWGILILNIAGFIFCCLYLPDLYAVSRVSTECLMLLVVFAIAVEPVYRYLTKLLECIQRLAAQVCEKISGSLRKR